MIATIPLDLSVFTRDEYSNIVLCKAWMPHVLRCVNENANIHLERKHKRKHIVLCMKVFAIRLLLQSITVIALIGHSLNPVSIY